MRLPVVIVTILALSGVAQAAPLVPGHVAADAKWFGHVNAEKIRSMPLFAEWKAKWHGEGRRHERVEEMSKKLGMNLTEDLLGLTLYATQYEGQLGVGLFYVKNLDREKMLAFFKEKHPDHKTTSYGDRTLYSWTAKCHSKKMELTGTFASDAMVVIGADAGHVKAALDVLDGKKPGLGTSAKLVQGVSEDALFVSQAIDVPEGYRKETKCPVLRNCTAAMAQWTERNGQIVGRYVLMADSAETAKNFKALVDGFQAMGNLRYSKSEAVKKVMDGLSCGAEGDVFSLVWKTTADDVKAAMKQVKKHKDKHHHGKKRAKTHEQ